MDGETAVFAPSVDGWEGPLDLLLALARAQKVDLRQISILALTEQYLGWIEAARAVKLELAADYLVMAAWLTLLKSALLLPRPAEPDADPDEMALRLQLGLERLAAMSEAGARLMASDRIGRDTFPRGAPEGLAVVGRRRWQAGLYDLMRAYADVELRSRPAFHAVRRRWILSLDAALTRLEAMLGKSARWTRLDALLPGADDPARARSTLASGFVAALELARQGKCELEQENAYAPLLLRARDATAR